MDHTSPKKLLVPYVIELTSVPNDLTQRLDQLLQLKIKIDHVDQHTCVLKTLPQACQHIQIGTTCQALLDQEIHLSTQDSQTLMQQCSELFLLNWTTPITHPQHQSFFNEVIDSLYLQEPDFLNKPEWAEFKKQLWRSLSYQTLAELT